MHLVPRRPTPTSAYAHLCVRGVAMDKADEGEYVAGIVDMCVGAATDAARGVACRAVWLWLREWPILVIGAHPCTEALPGALVAHMRAAQTAFAQVSCAAAVAQVARAGLWHAHIPALCDALYEMTRRAARTAVVTQTARFIRAVIKSDSGLPPPRPHRR